IETLRLTGAKTGQEHLDLIRDGVAVVDDVAEIMAFLEALEDVLECPDEIENRDLREGRRFGIDFGFLRLEGEAAFLLDLADTEERGGVLEFLVLDQLADQVPARIVLLDVFLRRLFLTRQ